MGGGYNFGLENMLQAQKVIFLKFWSVTGGKYRIAMTRSLPGDPISWDGNRQKRRTLFKSYLLEFEPVKYHISYQAFEINFEKLIETKNPSGKLF